MCLQVASHSRRHTTHDQVQAEKLHHLLMHQRVNFLLFVIAASQMVKDAIRHAVGAGKFLYIHREHFQYIKIADRCAANVFKLHAQQRPA